MGRNGPTQAHHNGEVSALHLGSALGDSPWSNQCMYLRQVVVKYDTWTRPGVAKPNLVW